MKTWKHLNSSNLISDSQYGFRKKRSTGDLLSLLSDSWSSVLRHFGESFAVALDISKAFDMSSVTAKDSPKPRSVEDQESESRERSPVDRFLGPYW